MSINTTANTTAQEFPSLSNADFAKMPLSDSKKVYLMSLGCSKNQVDSEIMLGNFKEQKYEYSAKIEDADVIVVNTCGFVDDSKTESTNKVSLFKYDVFKNRFKPNRK